MTAATLTEAAGPQPSPSAKWGVHINAKYAIYRLLHMLHITLHISAYFHCIFFAYLTNTVYIFAYYDLLHISCILLAIPAFFLAYICLLPAYFWHISGIFFTYLTNTVCIFAYFFCILKHIIAYLGLSRRPLTARKSQTEASGLYASCCAASLASRP